MSSAGDSLAHRVQESYLQLASVASDLNIVSDELGKSVSEIDAVLKKLNLGISVWTTIDSWESEEHDFSLEQVGYAKVDGRWGLALRTERGSNYCPDDSVVEEWLFSDGPRKLRLAAIEKLPEVLINLSKEAVATANTIKNKLAEVQQVAAAVKSAAEAPPPSKPHLRPIPRTIGKPVGVEAPK